MLYIRKDHGHEQTPLMKFFPQGSHYLAVLTEAMQISCMFLSV